MIRTLITITILISILTGGSVLATDEFAATKTELAATKAELAVTRAELNKLKYAKVKPIELHVRPIPEAWRYAYDDTANTQIFFNIASSIISIEEIAKGMTTMAAVINTVNDLDDPNSLAAKVKVLEETVADMPVNTNSDPNDPGSLTAKVTALEKIIADMPSIRFDINTPSTGNDFCYHRAGPSEPSQPSQPALPIKVQDSRQKEWGFYRW